MTWSLLSWPDTCAPTGTVLLGCKVPADATAFSTSPTVAVTTSGLSPSTWTGGSVPVVTAAGGDGQQRENRETSGRVYCGRRRG